MNNDRVKRDPNRKAKDAALRTVARYKVSRDVLVDDNQRPKTLRDSIYGDHGLGGEGQVIKREMIEHLKGVRDADAQLRLLPDLGMAEEVLISGILAPTDMTIIRLDVGCKVAAPPGFCDAIVKHFSSVFDYQSNQVDYLKKSLFRYGSVGLLPLPASSIKQLINDYEAKTNTTMQSGKHLLKDIPLTGILSTQRPSPTMQSDGKGSPPTRFIEVGITKAELVKETNAFITLLGDAYRGGEIAEDKLTKGLGQVTLCDNALALVIPKYQSAKKADKISKAVADAYGYGVGIKRRSDNLYENKAFVQKQIAHLTPGKTPTAEELNPIVIELRHDVIIPAFIPGTPDEAFGYYIAIDPTTGYPVQEDAGINYYEELNSYMENTALSRGANSSGPTTTGYSIGKDTATSAQYHQQMIELYASQLDKELKASLSENDGGDVVEVKCPEHLYRLMFARQLKNMNTMLVYVPAEMMTYMAYEYDDRGCGISLLKQTEIFTSLRATLMFASVVNGVRNAVPQRKLHITTDKNDPAKRETVATVLNEYARGQPSSLILNKFKAMDIVDAMSSAGITVEVDGGGYFPGTQISVEEIQRALSVPDTGLEENLRKLQYCGLSVTPEQVDAAFQGEFATGIITSNTIQAKKMMLFQNQHCTHSADFFRKYIWAGGPLFDELMEIYTKWIGTGEETSMDADGKVRKDEVVQFEELIDSIFVSLPQPNTAVIKAQLDEFTQFRTFLTEALPQYLTSDMIKDFMAREELAGSIDVGARAIEASILRRFLREHNMLPVIEELMYDVDNRLAKEIGTHNSATLTTLANILIETRASEKVQEDLIVKIMEKLNAGEEEAPASSGAATTDTAGDAEPTDEEAAAAGEDAGALDDIDATVTIDDGSGGDDKAEGSEGKEEGEDETKPAGDDANAEEAEAKPEEPAKPEGVGPAED